MSRAEFSRDNEEPIAWAAKYTCSEPRLDSVSHLLSLSGSSDSTASSSVPFARLALSSYPHYPLSIFQVRQTSTFDAKQGRGSTKKIRLVGRPVPILPFPEHILVSSNWFRPRWAGHERTHVLKNIVFVLEWCPKSAAQVSTELEGSTEGGAQKPDSASQEEVSTHQQRYLAVLTLSEAETVRRIIHVGRYGQKATNAESPGVEVVSSSSGLSKVLTILLQQKASCALRTIQGHVVDCTDDFVPEASRKGGDGVRPSVRSVEAGMQCLRFFNNDMFFSPEQLDLIISALPCDHELRRVFFEESLRRRRRERKVFTETPVNKLFVKSEHWDLLRPIALVARIRWRFYNELKQTLKLKLELEYLENKFHKNVVREQDTLTALMNMGFEMEAARQALDAADGNENRAAEMLMAGRFRPKPKVAGDPNGKWVCPACTMMNENVLRTCQICHTPWEHRDPSQDIPGDPQEVATASIAEQQRQADEAAARRLAEQEKREMEADEDPLQQEILAMQTKLQQKIKARPQSAEELFKSVLSEGATVMDTTAIERLLRLDEGVSFSSADVAGVLELGDDKGVGHLDLDSFTKLFVPEIPPAPEVSSLEETQWTCPQDGLPIPIGVERCPICGTKAPDDDGDTLAMSTANVAKPRTDQWECAGCHFFNKERLNYCEVCGGAKP